MQFTDWLEKKWVNPAYSGWVLIFVALCFFGAATNTMAGWLYVISGVITALLLVGAILPKRSLKNIKIDRPSISPVSAGNDLSVRLKITNPDTQPLSLIQIEDSLPFVLGKPQKTTLESIPPQSSDYWVYDYPTTRRGVYRWDTVNLRSAAPFGLFWSKKVYHIPAIAYVYPQILPLNKCPIVDGLGEDNQQQAERSLVQSSSEGITRNLRPYRTGDPMRLIHWRSSARYSQWQVRELEVFNSGNQVLIVLDSASKWIEEDFEEAVIAAATLYNYCDRHQLPVQLWTAGTGLISGHEVVLRTLAAIYPQEMINYSLPDSQSILITNNPHCLHQLPLGSRYLLWGHQSSVSNTLGKIINKETNLQSQLQKL